MNNIQLSCQGNTLTKPIMCWSMGDYLIGAAVFGIIFLIICFIIGSKIK